jgi:hypothetical protein
VTLPERDEPFFRASFVARLTRGAMSDHSTLISMTRTIKRKNHASD